MRRSTRTLIGSFCAIAMIFAAPVAQARENWQCVPFARLISGIQIFGDAWTWWHQADVAKYPTGVAPSLGAVLVFQKHGKMNKGHVAVVSQVITERVIQVTHANWSRIEGHRGQVEKDVTVVDVSAGGDWSQVKVWYDPARDLGATVYPTYGFIYQKPEGENLILAAARGATETAMNQVAAVLPLASPGQVLVQAQDGADRIAVLISQAISGDKKE
jgi:surface antigen